MEKTNIGQAIKAKRLELKLSAKYVGERLSKPITKQAFLKREAVGRFPFDEVVEIAAIFNCTLGDLHAPKTTEICRDKKAG